MMRRTFEEKLEVVKLLLDGYPLRRLCKERHIDLHTVREWRSRYLLYGERGLLEGSSKRRFSKEEKAAIVEAFVEKSVTLHTLCVSHDVARSTIKGWVRASRKGGAPAEKGKRQEREEASMGRPKKREPRTELERLQAENLRLRAENALLKKVKALVEEQEAMARRNGQKPSMN